MCLIDHTDPVTIPRIMCRLCNPILNEYKPAIAPAGEPIACADPEPMRGYAPHASAAVLAWQANGDDTREAVKQYQEQKRLCAYQQWAAENPELVKARRAAKRDKEKSIARMGIKATGKVRRKRV